MHYNITFFTLPVKFFFNLFIFYFTNRLCLCYSKNTIKSVRMTDKKMGMGIYMNEIKEKSVEVSRTEVSHLLCNRDMNGAGRLFGGQLLMWIDEVAGIVAKRHCECNVTTASIDNLQFKEACYLGDVIVLIGYLTHVGNSSMEVRIDTYVEKKNGKRYPVNRAFFIMVALDENDHPVRVPRLSVSSIEEQAKWEAAERRVALRKTRREEGF